MCKIECVFKKTEILSQWKMEITMAQKKDDERTNSLHKTTMYFSPTSSSFTSLRYSGQSWARTSSENPNSNKSSGIFSDGSNAWKEY